MKPQNSKEDCGQTIIIAFSRSLRPWVPASKRDNRRDRGELSQKWLRNSAVFH